MLDALLGWSLNQQLGVEFGNIRFKETILASDTSSISLTDEVDASILNSKTAMTAKDFLIIGVYSYVTPGNVTCRVLPDNETIRQFYLNAEEPRHTPIQPPRLCQVDLVVDLTNNDAVPNTVYLDFSVAWFSQNKLSDVTDVANLFTDALVNIDEQTYTSTLLLIDIRDLLGQLVILQGGTTGDWYSGEYTPKRAKEPCKNFCKRRSKT